MGDYADMMIDGTCCSMCGEYIGESRGYAVTCVTCSIEDDGDLYRPSKTRCPECNKLVKKVGLAQHMQDKHGAKP